MALRWLLLAVVATAAAAAEGLLPPHANVTDHDACGGVKVYVYRDLPRAFSDPDGGEDLLDVPPENGRRTLARTEWGVPCQYDLKKTCEHLAHWGRGEGLRQNEVPKELQDEGMHFTRTLQNALPWMFTGHVLAHCAAETPEEAQLFLVPYPATQLRRAVKHSKEVTVAGVNKHYEKVKRFLEAQPAWQRCNGCDHLLSMEAPILWFGQEDLRKRGGYFNEDPFWNNVVRLSHHASAYEAVSAGPAPVEAGVEMTLPVVSMPWPLTFHAGSDEQVERWVDYMFDPSHKRSPKALIVANYRPHREKLLNLCEARDTPCEHDKAMVHSEYFGVYRDFTFSLQPGGDSPTRRAFFEALVSGCIPIVFDPAAAVAGRADYKFEPLSRHYRSAYAPFFGDATGWGEDWLDKVALVAKDEDDAMRLIRTTSPKRIAEIQANIRSIMPMLLFWDHTLPRAAQAQESKYRHLSTVPTILRILAKQLPDRRN